MLFVRSGFREDAVRIGVAFRSKGLVKGQVIGRRAPAWAGFQISQMRTQRPGEKALHLHFFLARRRKEQANGNTEAHNTTVIVDWIL